MQEDVRAMQFKQTHPLVIDPKLSFEDLKKLPQRGSDVFGGKGLVVDVDRKLFVVILDEGTRQNSEDDQLRVGESLGG